MDGVLFIALRAILLFCGACYHRSKFAFPALGRLPCIPHLPHGHSQTKREKFNLVCAGEEISKGWHWFSRHYHLLAITKAVQEASGEQLACRNTSHSFLSSPQ